MHADKALEPQLAIPFAGGDFSPWVKHFDGQLDWYVPRACMVSRAFAWEVISEFCRTQKRSAVVPWVDKDLIKCLLPGAGDKIPVGKDRA